MGIPIPLLWHRQIIRSVVSNKSNYVIGKFTNDQYLYNNYSKLISLKFRIKYQK